MSERWRGMVDGIRRLCKWAGGLRWALLLAAVLALAALVVTVVA